MSHLDGINYGTDQVSGFDEPDLEYHLQDWHGKTILATHAEHPPKKGFKSTIPDSEPIADVPLIRESFTTGPVDLTYLIVILLIVVIALQIAVLARATVFPVRILEGRAV